MEERTVIIALLCQFQEVLALQAAEPSGHGGWESRRIGELRCRQALFEFLPSSFYLDFADKITQK